MASFDSSKLVSEAPVEQPSSQNVVGPMPPAAENLVSKAPEEQSSGESSQPIGPPPPSVSPAKKDNSAFYQHGLLPIKQMQQALINLSKDVANHNIHDVEDRYSTVDETSRDLLNGANSFMNFMVTNYMNKAQVTGKQLVNTDVRQPTRMESSKPNDSFKGVLNSIQHIGAAGQDKKPDGDWGVRTNNALQQVYSLAYALMHMTKDMGLNLNGYTEADLSELYNAIPKDIEKTSINEKVEKANIVSKNLDKLRALYDSFRESILNNPTYRAQIAQEKPLTVGKSKTKNMFDDVLNDHDKALFAQHNSAPLDVSLNGNKTTVAPVNLQSMDTFKAFLNSNKNLLTQEQLTAINAGDNQTINKFLIEIANGLGQ